MTILVTGGGGFLGRAIVQQLLERGLKVRTLQRGDYPELRALGAETIRGNLTDSEIVKEAVKGCDAVFHVAAKAGIWGDYNDYYQSNVVGTRNVLEASQAAGVRKFIYTSTPSVVHGGDNLEGINEDAPYPTHFSTHYPKTKATAERAVLKANRADFLTVALRPHLIWGPGDNHLAPRLVQRAKSGRLKLVGTGDNLVDCIYIDNAATAHLQAYDALAPDSACAGKPYFITQGEPIACKDLINGIHKSAALPAVTQSVSPGLAKFVGWLFEAIYRAFAIQSDPPMTRFLAEQLSTSHWYDISRAKKDFNYEPTISTQEGFAQLAEWFQKNPVQP